MKGYREEIPKEEFHRILCDAFGVREIHSEYGMAELTSQAYSQGGNRFRCPAWMRVTVRDVNDPFDLLPPGSRGGLNIADLANRWSCAFIQTQDVGRVEATDRFWSRGPHRPLRHPRLQPAGTMKYRLKYQGMYRSPECRSYLAFRRVCKSDPPLTPRPGRELNAASGKVSLRTPLQIIRLYENRRIRSPSGSTASAVAGKNLRSLSGSPLMCHIPENP